jgi:hypothetical protein
MWRGSSSAAKRSWDLGDRANRGQQQQSSEQRSLQLQHQCHHALQEAALQILVHQGSF